MAIKSTTEAQEPTGGNRMPDDVDTKPDMSCFPYRRKGLYFILTAPFLVFLILVFVYLWSVSFILSLVFLAFYLAMCYFQTYCCAYQDCPYIGGFCPAVAGIMPASLLAKLIYSRKQIVKSKRSFEIYATLAIIAWLGLIVFPLFWIVGLGIPFAVGYVACHAVYYVVYVLTICPACAIRHTCPGGKLQSRILKR
jgi:hypothetical protein